MPLGMHKDSLINLVELAAKAEQDEHDKGAGSKQQRIQQSAGISSTEAGGSGLPRSASFGNEKQLRDGLREGENIEGEGDVTDASMFWPAAGNTGIVRVFSENSITNIDNTTVTGGVGVGDDSLNEECEGAGASTYLDPSNRARPAVWREAAASQAIASNIASRGGSTQSWQSNMSYGTDLDSYYDPYASTDQAPPKRRGGDTHNCLCLFAPWGAAQNDADDDSDMDDGDYNDDRKTQTESERREQNVNDAKINIDSGDTSTIPKPSRSTLQTQPMAIPTPRALAATHEHDYNDNDQESKRSIHSSSNADDGAAEEKKSESESDPDSTTDDVDASASASAVIQAGVAFEILKFGSTPKQNVAGVMVKASGSAPRERLLRKTLEQVHQLHATQPASPAAKQLVRPGGMSQLRVLSASASCKPPEKSLLKKHINHHNKEHAANAKGGSQSDSNNKGSRRSIFATTDSATSSTDLPESTVIQRYHSGCVRKTCRFAPTARVATIPSRDSLSLFDRSLIWWTRSDYDSFKKTGRTIARAMVEGGSHIWLQSQFTREEKKKFGTDETEDESTSQKMGEKWWCKFGHSRRGLEHIANMEEGRLRQQSVQNAMDAVMKEQRKQKIASGNGTGVGNDSGKISRICQQYTRWAKELAILAGLGDAEAVRTEFQTHNAPVTSRAKMTHSSMYTSYVTRNFNFTSEVAEKDANRSCWNPGVLDEHTSGSLLVKLNDEYDMHAMAEEGVKAAREHKIADDAAKAATVAAAAALKKRVEQRSKSGGSAEYVDSNSEEPIHDARNSVSGSLSKKAAGLGHGENDLDRFLEKRFEKVPVHQAA
jgi:hypothetical protein